VVNNDQFQTAEPHTDMLRICCGCVPASTVIYGHLLLTTEEMKFLNIVKIARHGKTKTAEA